MIEWNRPEERLIEYGLDRGVLYLKDSRPPVAWNGLVGLDESLSSTQTVHYRDGRIFMVDVEAGDFSATLSAFYFPDAFAELSGLIEVSDGFFADGQKPQMFDLSYRTLIGSGATGDRFGYQIHLVYNATAMISDRNRKTVTAEADLEPIKFDIQAVPEPFPGIRPTAHFTIDTRNLSQSSIEEIEDILYGDTARMPSPIELHDILNFGDEITFVLLEDGDFMVTASYRNLDLTVPGFVTIKNVNATDNGDGTYTLHDTP